MSAYPSSRFCEELCKVFYNRTLFEYYDVPPPLDDTIRREHKLPSFKRGWDQVRTTDELSWQQFRNSTGLQHVRQFDLTLRIPQTSATKSPMHCIHLHIDTVLLNITMHLVRGKIYVMMLIFLDTGGAGDTIDVQFLPQPLFDFIFDMYSMISREQAPNEQFDGHVLWKLADATRRHRDRLVYVRDPRVALSTEQASISCLGMVFTRDLGEKLQNSIDGGKRIRGSLPRLHWSVPFSSNSVFLHQTPKHSEEIEDFM